LRWGLVERVPSLACSERVSGVKSSMDQVDAAALLAL